MAVIAPELKNGQPIVVGMNPAKGKVGTRGEKKLHVVVTAYNKDSGRLPLKRMSRDGELRYLNTRKSPGFDQGSGHRLSSNVDDFRGSKQKIHTERDLGKYPNQNKLLSC